MAGESDLQHLMDCHFVTAMLYIQSSIALRDGVDSHNDVEIYTYIHTTHTHDRNFICELSIAYRQISGLCARHPKSTEGCCSAVALLTGQRLVVATLGDVAAVLCLRTGAQELIPPHAVEEDSESEGTRPPGRWGGSCRSAWRREGEDAVYALAESLALKARVLGFRCF